MKAFNFFSSVRDWTVLAIVYIVAMFMLGTFANIVWPATTMLFVLFCTGCGVLSGGWKAVLTIAGLATYILSWMSLWNWGWTVTEAQLLCGVGIITWIGGACYSTASLIIGASSLIKERPV